MRCRANSFLKGFSCIVFHNYYLNSESRHNYIVTQINLKFV